MSNVSRRSFIQGAGMATAAVACTSTAVAVAEEVTAEQASSWRTAPEAPAEVAEEASCDVLVIGLGHAGSCAARAAAEQGAVVCAFEKQAADSRSYMSGGQVGNINSELLKAKGVPEVDELVFMNDWMLRHNNRCNPGLIRAYAANSGKCFDWLYGDWCTDPDSITVRQWPVSDSYQEEVSGLRGFIGCVYTGDFMSDALDACSQAVLDNGGTIYHETTGYLLITDESGAVTGAYGERADGTYVKVSASKGVILCGGGFGGNAEMLNDLYQESKALIAEGEELTGGMDQDGSGLKLGYWAGGKIDPCIGAMGGNYFYPCDSPSDPAGTAPVLWLNSQGKRYCNEGFGSIELAAIPGAKEPSGIVATVFGSNVDEYVYAQVPSHMSIDYSSEKSQPLLSGLHETMEKALAGGENGSADTEESSESDGGFGAGVTMYCSEDLATLAGYLGYTGEAVDNFVAAVERYNEMCEAGRDEDFGKDAHLLIKLEAPYYGYAAEREIGSPMVTTSGLLVNENSQVLDQHCDPIPGLYAAGNNSGSRFGYQYTTPISGVSLGFAETQGYMAGNYVGAL